MMNGALPDGLPSASRTIGKGCLNVMRKDLASTASNDCRAANILSPNTSRLPQRVIDAITSAEVTGLPSLNASPLRSVNVQVLLSGEVVYVSTISGCTTPLASTPNRVS